MKVSIHNPERTLFEGVVSQVILPACDEELSLMDNHEPVLVALGKGCIRLQPVTQQLEALREQAVTYGPFLIHRGMARMKANELVILVE